jgi:NTE family protein
VGALEILEKHGILKNIQRVGGTSAGAINAVLLALGFSRNETLDIFQSLNFRNFLDDSWGVLRDTDRLINEFGWYKGDFFRQWIGSLVREKAGNEHATFNELKNKTFKDLYLVGTNLSTGFAEVFSFEHTPRMRVVDAVRISMSLPLFFTAVRGMRGDVYVDGGMLDNYPVKLFDREKYIVEADRPTNARQTDYYKEANKSAPPTSSPYVYNLETLGFRLDSGREIAIFRDGAEPDHTKINDLFDYIKTLVKTLLNVQENQHLHEDDWHRTVYINTIGVGTTDFDIGDDKKDALVEEGKKGTQDYLDWYDKNDRQDRPLNRLA